MRRGLAPGGGSGFRRESRPGRLRRGGIGNTSANLLYGLGRNTAGARAQLAADVSQARFHKMNGDFENALIKLDTVVARDPDDPEALFLRAQILWEGYGDRQGAKQSLIRLFAAQPDRNACTRRWGKVLYRQMVQQEKDERTSRQRRLQA